MINRIILLAAALLLALACACSAGAESQSQRAVKIKMDLSSSRVQAGNTIHVEISITNISGADFTEPVTLYYPNGKQIKLKGTLKGIDNLYLAGQWTNSPGGLPVAAASGKFAIQRILKKQRRDINI